MASATLNGSPFPNKPEGYFPSESDPYIVKSVECTNGTEGYWDEEKKKIILTTPNLPTTCVVDFTDGYTVTMKGTGAVISAPTSQVVGRKGEAVFNYSVTTGYNKDTAEVICDGGANPLIEENTIKITNINKANTCTITLTKNQYTVNVSSNNTTYGTVSPASRTVEHGGSTTFTISPKTGYKYSSNTCEGTVSENILTISNVTSNKDCTVTFVIDVSKLKTLANTIKTVYPPKAGRTNFSSIDNGTPSLYTGSDDQGTTYYFSGDGSRMNNWVSFAGSLWRVIRINGNGSVRLLYAGSGGEDGYVGTSAYNTLNNHPAYVGWKYTVGGSESSDRGNSIASSAYKIVNTWYEANIINANLINYIDTEAIYCNARDIKNGSYGLDNLFYYEGQVRLEVSKSPTFSCTNISDRFTTFGLMTADEVAFAGGVWNTNSPKAYYYVNINNGSSTGNKSWLTMSPCFYNGVYGTYMFQVELSGRLRFTQGHYSSEVIRPVISLKSSVVVTGGDGSGTNPYTVSIP